MNPRRSLEQLQSELSTPTEECLDPRLYETLSFAEVDGLFHVTFSRSLLSERYYDLCEMLRHRDMAGRLVSLYLRGPDMGVNGTCNWDLSPLLEGDVTYQNLLHVSLPQNGPDTHNRIIVAADYEEEGVLGELLRRAQNLDTLDSPSAPDASFFDVRDHPLRYLNVDAGFDTQDFIGNLARSTCFPGLQHLEFGEYNETYLDTYPDGCTPFADYEALLRSRAGRNLHSLTVRNPMWTPIQSKMLKELYTGQLRPTFTIVRFSREYL